MVVRRWDPFRDLLAIQNEMNRLFGRTFGPTESGAAEDVGAPDAPGTRFGTAWVPALDVYETDRDYTIVAELPGMTTGDVDITVEDNVLTLRGERPFYEGTPEDAFHRIERRFGPFQRRVSLPQQCDVGQIDASMAGGLLTIRVGKVEKARPKRIEVKAQG